MSNSSCFSSASTSGFYTPIYSTMSTASDSKICKNKTTVWFDESQRKNLQELREEFKHIMEEKEADRQKYLPVFDPENLDI